MAPGSAGAGAWGPCVVTAPVRHCDPTLLVLPREDYGGALRMEAKWMAEWAGVLGQQVTQARHE